MVASLDPKEIQDYSNVKFVKGEVPEKVGEKDGHKWKLNFAAGTH